MEDVFFKVQQEDFSGKALAREFGDLLLRSREGWRRASEPLLLAALWYCAFRLLLLAVTPTNEIEFLSTAVTIIGAAISLLIAGVALWGTVYILWLRPAVVGRKRLQKVQGDSVTYHFLADKMVSDSAGKQMDIPYDLGLIEICYVGKTAHYLKLAGVPKYLILQRNCFISGNFEEFPAFYKEKIGKTVQHINKHQFRK